MLCLILTQDDDVHAEKVKSKVKKLGGQPIFFKRYNKNNYIAYCYKKLNSEAYIVVDDVKYDLADVSSIFRRIKPVLPGETTGENSTAAERFKVSQWKDMSNSIEDFCPSLKLCINSMSESKYKYGNKAFQLKLAQQCGLNIPKTCISNSNTSIAETFLDGEQIIYKNLYAFFTTEGTTFTNKVTREDILAGSESIGFAPGIFQELVEKSHELRIIIVGEEFFIAKIDSQKYPETKLDWRRDQSKDMFSWGELSEDTKNKLLAFHKETNLVYGNYDFIVRPNGEEVFLECNTSGQWLFLGDEIGDCVTTAIAKLLVQE